MPETPKKKTEKAPEKGDESSWAKDQEERDYYYDDSHGYEIFDPEEADEDDDEDQ